LQVVAMAMAALCMLLAGSVERPQAAKNHCHRHHSKKKHCHRKRCHRHHYGRITDYGRKRHCGAKNPAGPSRSLLWGAWVGSQFTGSEAPWDWNAVGAFERQNAGGKHLSVLNWSSPFYSLAWCGGDCNFNPTTFQKVRAQGVMPFFSWGSGASNKALAAGTQDDYIRRWALAAAGWGHPMFLRFNWEMNGNWFNWGVGSGSTPADYVAAWRHVHDIFDSVGATNVSWVWCPNVDPGRMFADVASLYPGDSYVDFTCLDGYNGNDPWTSFTSLFGSSYDRLMQIAPSKPMIIGEVGSTESGGSKAQWISDMFAALPQRFPNVRGLLWMDKYILGPGGQSDWPVETSASASAAFASGLAGLGG
jgi:Glycosyl hydrolase family 26